MLTSLLTSYKDAPADKEVPDGMYYNAAYPGNLIAMPQPIYGDDVSYADGASTDISSIASDLVYFLTWTAELCSPSKKIYEVASNRRYVCGSAVCIRNIISIYGLWHSN